MIARRKILIAFLSLTGLGALATFLRSSWRSARSFSKEGLAVILNSFPLHFQWPTQEPFLFCVHHNDFYPKGLPNFGPPKEMLSGRNMGQDFEGKDGFRMYHGEVVPGFPVHPHRGFETITIVRRGYIDHADSMGAAGRYGEGDVQWMTAGAGVQHSEMFPLLHQDKENTCELFQIWLNLPRRSKMSTPHFKMFWSEKIPQWDLDESRVRLSLIAGNYDNKKSLAPPPDSWAADENNEVLILLVKMKAGGKMPLPASKSQTHRTLYFFEGDGLFMNDNRLSKGTGYNLDSTADLMFMADGGDLEFLILQARPIGEPVFQHGPFVMNTREEIIRTIHEYQKSEFGGWPWPRPDMVHGPKIERFAKYPDGHTERP